MIDKHKKTLEYFGKVLTIQLGIHFEVRFCKLLILNVDCFIFSFFLSSPIIPNWEETITPSPTPLSIPNARMAKPLEFHITGKIVLSDLHSGSNIPNGNSVLCDKETNFTNIMKYNFFNMHSVVLLTLEFLLYPFITPFVCSKQIERTETHIYCAFQRKKKKISWMHD